ncbi:histone-lysine N-methyltransferase [Gaeumannomyces tritici R3-111a-1]|uniref:Histone-lysine N-methyltransferase, H3 lysine-36 specific n=1 Tax=Gaeumannomyces tritici (strain R3-111a-1) TaxID=644352 RepID=J3NKW3_GAET3|nr:histone-lysine N-methyltransferase [Gaeumannomyces tritici R3-111a-1]EJT81930.1 histone-lysine N-methyltransferase [Gaeumannomyces tritici R3-111a-1]
MGDRAGPNPHAPEILNGAEPAVNGHGSRAVKMERSSSDPTTAALRADTSSPMDEDAKSASKSAGASPPDAESAPKPLRKSSKASVSRPPILFSNLPDATEEASRGFAVLSDCVYASKALGNSDQETLDCDCEEEYRDGVNHACGDDSDCINRHTKIECVGGNCGEGCQNQRFQAKQYAKVSVIKTEKKGFGLRADTDLDANDFVFEYIGEVIGEELFRRRLMKYDDQRLEHFYFMSLTRTEYVDATKKGNLGRFCNHSCNPNCFVDKWVVGDKLRMGIFALRAIKAGEELCFNYNVDRYGANPQRCHCGEPSCSGTLGGKTQTERATKLPMAMVEALGIDDGDHWESSVANKKPRKKRANETEEEYVNSIQSRELEDGEVGVVMSSLRSCKEKWIVGKLLERLQNVEEDRVLGRVVKLHGYEYLKTTLNTFKDDNGIVLQVLDILYKLPRMTRNKIDDAKIEPIVVELSSSEHDEVSRDSKRLLDEWKTLQVGYRIPRAKVDRNAANTASSLFDDRRQQAREAAAAPTPKAPSPIRNAPTGPRNSQPQRNPHYVAPRRRAPPPRDNTPLPAGWRSAIDENTKRWYYWETANPDQKSWVRPSTEAAKVTVAMEAQRIQDIINQCRQPTPKPISAAQTPQAAGTPVAEAKKDRWRSWPVEKQRKLYENTIFPQIKHVADKFYKRLPKEDLKKFVKEINKNLAASDYKHGRVDDPSRISERQESKVRKYTRDFLEKAVKKHEQWAAERTGRKTRDQAGEEPKAATGRLDAGSRPPSTGASPMPDKDVVSDVDAHLDSPGSPSDLKRKRSSEDDAESMVDELTPGETPSLKRLREGDVEAPSPPPPPTPPPLEDLDDAVMIEEVAAEKRLQEHEDALVRENEEAKQLQLDAAEQARLREHEAALERENQEALIALQNERRDEDAHMTNGNMTKLDAVAMDLDGVGGGGDGTSNLGIPSRKREVLGH